MIILSLVNGRLYLARAPESTGPIGPRNAESLIAPCLPCRFINFPPG